MVAGSFLGEQRHEGLNGDAFEMRGARLHNRFDRCRFDAVEPPLEAFNDYVEFTFKWDVGSFVAHARFVPAVPPQLYGTAMNSR